MYQQRPAGRFPDVIHLIVILILFLTASGCASQRVKPAPSISQPLSPELEKVRAELEKYEDPMVAVRDGYLSMVGCMEYPSGGVGIRFFNTSFMSTAADPYHPPVLIYEPAGERLRLAAAEWFIPLNMGITERPVLLGQPFHGPMEGHHPLMPRELVHYDLPIWLFKENPAGLYSPTHPEIKCPQTLVYRFQEEPPQFVQPPQAIQPPEAAGIQQRPS